MCRMALVTATNQKPRVVLDLLLRMGQEDNGQNDGAGVYVGGSVYTTHQPMQDWAAPWMRDNSAYVPMIGHRRKASAGTGRTILEAHPYLYDVAGEPLVFAHNGFINGTGTSKVDEPNTDSWRAGAHLASLLAENGEFTSQFVTNWLSEYTDAAFAMLFYWRGRVYMTRNNKRAFFLRRIGDGYVGASSHAALSAATEALYDAEDIRGEVLTLNPDQLVVTDPGSTELTVLGDVVPVYKSYQQRAAATQPVHIENKKKGDDDAGDKLCLPAYMPRLPGSDPAPAVPGNGTALAPRTMRSAKARLSMFYSRFTPLSKHMVNFWLCTALDLFSEEGEIHKSRLYPPLIRLIDTDQGLEDLVDFLCDGHQINARIVNFWNHAVDTVDQLEATALLFEPGHIWWKSAASADDDQLDRELRVFQRDFVGMLAVLDAREIQRLFNYTYIQQATNTTIA